MQSSTHTSAHLLIHLPVDPSIRWVIYPSIRPSKHLSSNPYIHPHFQPSCPPSIPQSVSSSVYPPLHTSIHASYILHPFRRAAWYILRYYAWLAANRCTALRWWASGLVLGCLRQTNVFCALVQQSHTLSTTAFASTVASQYQLMGLYSNCAALINLNPLLHQSASRSHACWQTYKLYCTKSLVDSSLYNRGSNTS